jgi:hypothetical protein
MKAVLFSLALLGSQSALAVSDRVPQLNVEALCKSTSAIDEAMDLAEAQSFSDCMRDEMTAQQQLGAIWATSAGPARDQCEGEAVAGDTQSYVDLLTCMQMANAVTSVSPPAPLREASKGRNSK